MVSYQTKEGIILREESFGGIAFLKDKAITIELDKEGFHLLKSLSNELTLPDLKLEMERTFNRIFLDTEIEEILECLCQQGFIDKSNALLRVWDSKVVF